MRLYAIRFSDGSTGRLMSQEDAQRAFDRIDADRRPFCTLTCWEEVVEPTAPTLRPSAPVDLPPNLFTEVAREINGETVPPRATSAEIWRQSAIGLCHVNAERYSKMADKSEAFDSGMGAAWRGAAYALEELQKQLEGMECGDFPPDTVHSRPPREEQVTLTEDKP